jgi:hypothetical protein
VTEYTLILRTASALDPQLYTGVLASSDAAAEGSAQLRLLQIAKLVPTLSAGYLYRDHELVKSFSVFTETHVTTAKGTV